jgi:hypothetical protein
MGGYEKPANHQHLAAIELLVESLIPFDSETGLPSAEFMDFSKFLDAKGELEEYLLEFGKLIEKLELKLGVKVSQISVNLFIYDKDLKKCLTSILGMRLVDYYYQIPQVRAYYAQNIPAPFPQGNTLLALDYELLEGVHSRGPIYRKV